MYCSCSIMGWGKATAGEIGTCEAEKIERRSEELAGERDVGRPKSWDLADPTRKSGRGRLPSSDDLRGSLPRTRPRSSLDLKSQSGTTWRLKSSATSGTSIPSWLGPAADLCKTGRGDGGGERVSLLGVIMPSVPTRICRR